MVGRITVSYGVRQARAGQHAVLAPHDDRGVQARAVPDPLFQQANPARIDAYRRAVARELAEIDTDARRA
jgi:hypothetical protein